MYQARPHRPEWIAMYFRLQDDSSGEKTIAFLKAARDFVWELFKIDESDPKRITMTEVLFALRHVPDEHALAVVAFTANHYRTPIDTNHVAGLQRVLTR